MDSFLNSYYAANSRWPLPVAMKDNENVADVWTTSRKHLGWRMSRRVDPQNRNYGRKRVKNTLFGKKHYVALAQFAKKARFLP